MAYRVGDSVTNIITILMSYLLAFLFTWLTMLAFWIGPGLPIGPDARISVTP